MAKLPERNQKLTEQGDLYKCWLCGEIIEEEKEMKWFEGRPAHERCAWEEE